MADNQSGIALDGNKAVLENINGRVIKFIIAISVSIVLIVEERISDMPEKIKEKNMEIKIITSTPRNPDANLTPRIYAKNIIIADWSAPWIEAESVFPKGMDALFIGAARSLSRYPILLSQIMLVPAKIPLKRDVIIIIPGVIKER